MEAQNLSGDSAPSVEQPLNYSYNLGGDTTEQVDAVVPHTEDEPKVESTSVDTTAQEQAKQPTQWEVESAKRMVIDTVEDKFKDLANGKLTGPELKEWFIDHPEIADTASKAKRVKDTFKTFMASTDEIVTTPDEVKPEVKQESAKDAPVTLQDIEKMLNERETKVLESQLSRDRQTVSEQFAASRSILDGDYENLKTTAELLYKSNPTLYPEYKDALEASQRALFPTKGKPVQVPVSQTAPTIQTEEQNEIVDLVSKGFTYQIRT